MSIERVVPQKKTPFFVIIVINATVVQKEVLKHECGFNNNNMT